MNIMSTIELQKELIQKISKIEDFSFLKTIKTILEIKENKKTLYVPNEILAEIRESQAEYKKGLFIDSEELDKEVEKWLNEK